MLLGTRVVGGEPTRMKSEKRPSHQGHSEPTRCRRHPSLPREKLKLQATPHSSFVLKQK